MKAHCRSCDWFKEGIGIYNCKHYFINVKAWHLACEGYEKKRDKKINELKQGLPDTKLGK